MRYAEYCQQIKHLKMTVPEIQKMLNQKTCDYAFLVHDKDELEDGTKKEPHIHVMMNFKGNSWQAKDLCQWFRDDENRIERAKSKGKRYVWENMCSYLIHETESADGKYKYPPEDVTANFDFIGLIEKARQGIKEAEESRKWRCPISDQLQMICNDKIPRIKIEEYISDLDRIRYSQYIEQAYKIRDERLMKEVNRNMDVMYFYGDAGTGKTTLAKYLANEMNLTVFVAGSSNDPLEGYIGQECIILDDLRGSDWKINDLLKMLDNHTTSLVKARYKNKLMNDCKIIMITSVQDVDEMYKNLKDNEKEPIEQLKRRCRTFIKVERERITFFEYNDISKEYEQVRIAPNPVPSLTMLKQNRQMLNKMMDILDKIEMDENEKAALPF